MLAPLQIESELTLLPKLKSKLKEVDIVMVEVAVLELGLTVTEDGLKLAEEPLGRLEADRLTVTGEL